MDYYSIEELDKTGLVKTLMTSEGRGCWFSNDPQGHENYRAVASDFGISAERDMVGTFQRHSGTVMAVTRENAGQNVLWRAPEPEAWDGIVTNEPGLMLTSMESDCVPVFLLDPVRKTIGMVHSGWRGAVKDISVTAVRLMASEYGSRPEDILAAFGPCICGRCYEVSDDLIAEFSALYSEEELRRIFVPKAGGKYLLNMNLAIRIRLEGAGVKPENIFDAEYCTYHQNIFYSHRRQVRDSLPTTDNMLTAIMLLP